MSYSTFKVRVYALYGYHRQKETSLTHHNCITVLITYWKQVNHDEKLIKKKIKISQNILHLDSTTCTSLYVTTV